MAKDGLRNVLFLCTANSARSIMAEALLGHWGKGKFAACSAGSFPKGAINPHALELLRRMKLPTAGLRSKSWDEFARPAAPTMDFVFTVCDQAAAEICPVWPGQPITAHWGVPDPAAAAGTEAEVAAAFADVFRMLERRIQIFAALPLGSLSRLELARRVGEIGARAPEPA
jgi:protein-tyrosine-phosphatase